MVVAGIDASTKATGLAIMDEDKLIYHTVIKVDPKKVPDAHERIKIMFVKICEILDRYDIDEMHIEKAICKGGNIDTTMKLAYLSGGMSLYCLQRQIKFYNPIPSEWRKIVGIKNGRGVVRDDQKAQAIQFVKYEYGIDVGDDEAEATLIARSAFDLPKINISEYDLWE